MSFRIEYRCEDCEYIIVTRKEPEKCQNVKCPSNRPKLEYPIYKKHILNGKIFKFTNIAENEYVFISKSKNGIRNYITVFIPHTNENVWEDVIYNKELDLFDTQPVLCWSNDDTTYRAVRFYDARNNCGFMYNGKRNGIQYDNMVAYPAPYPNFVLDMHEKLEK